EAAVTASHEIEPARGLRQGWAPVREACYGAAEAYLQLAQQDPEQPLAPAAVYEQALARIGSATRILDEFYANNRGPLEHAAAVSAATPQIAHRARVNARAAAQALQAPDAAPFAGYPSVRAATVALESEMA